MHRKYFFVILVLLVASFLLIAFFFTQKAVTEEAQENVAPRPSPFSAYINGVGTVEPKSGNINIGIPFNRIVKKIKVSLNDRITKGEVLLELDHQDLQANLQIKQSEYDIAVAMLNKLKEQPRKEDLVVAEQMLKRAQVDLNETKTQYDMIASLPNPGAISKEDRDKRLYRYQSAQAQLIEKQAEFDKIEAGTWKPELEIALQQVKQAKASVEAIEADIERTLIKSPINGTVLQIKIREGETVSSDPSKPVMIVGAVDELYLKVGIDQYDVPLLRPNARAIAYRQGANPTEYPLAFVVAEPFMVQKKYLTNVAGEKVDTQVLEILYRITKKEPPLFIGEQMDVLIDVEKK